MVSNANGDIQSHNQFSESPSILLVAIISPYKGGEKLCFSSSTYLLVYCQPIRLRIFCNEMLKYW